MDLRAYCGFRYICILAGGRVSFAVVKSIKSINGQYTVVNCPTVIIAADFVQVISTH